MLEGSPASGNGMDAAVEMMTRSCCTSEGADCRTRMTDGRRRWSRIWWCCYWEGVVAVGRSSGCCYWDGWWLELVVDDAMAAAATATSDHDGDLDGFVVGRWWQGTDGVEQGGCDNRRQWKRTTVMKRDGSRHSPPPLPLVGWWCCCWEGGGGAPHRSSKTKIRIELCWKQTRTPWNTNWMPF